MFATTLATSVGPRTATPTEAFVLVAYHGIMWEMDLGQHCTTQQCTHIS
jgi:hypothetical protein